MHLLCHSGEAGAHAAYDLGAFSASLDSAISSSPLCSFRRWYPVVMLLDNNFSDDRVHMLRVCELLRLHPKVRGWGALVTQNILQDRALVREMARASVSGCSPASNCSIPPCCDATTRHRT